MQPYARRLNEHKIVNALIEERICNNKSASIPRLRSPPTCAQPRWLSLSRLLL
jgi:hypothetical protein